jgi:7-cyano-7-deazaguanine synthase
MLKADAVVLLSGGMDSLVCAALALKDHKKVAFIHMNYGQRTSHKEQFCFEKISAFYAIPSELQRMVDLRFLSQIGGSSLTDQNMSVATFDGDKPGIPSSYVPFRNSIILSLAVSWAEVLGAQNLYIGANEEDSPGYPDCRKEYYKAFQEVIHLGTKDGKINIETPVISLTKQKIVELGVKLQAPFELTWSCYAESGQACGVCDSCALRLRGFKMANVKDPISYRK